MSTYYRLAQIPNTLPLHWAYSDAWDYLFDENKEEYVWQDNRVEGFQVFAEASQAVRALLGDDLDGCYPASEYPQLLIIEADDDYVYDGCSMYFAIKRKGVESVKAIDSKVAIEAIAKLYESQKDQYDYDDISDWCSDSDEEIVEILNNLSISTSVTFIETLPHPELVYA